MGTYLRNVWRARYFWTHLALADIRTKYRRSVLGVVWAILFPLAMTLLLTLVMGTLFKSDLGEYAPYIFSGLIFWDFLTGCVIAGCSAVINSETYIKQYVHPVAIYPLRYSIAALINLGFAFVGLVLWILLWRPGNIGYSWLTLPPSFCLLFLLGWPLAILASFINTRFRDFQQLIVLILQAVWYISPVFIDVKVLRTAKLDALVDLNPVYHILNIFRAPILEGEFPSAVSLFYVAASILVAWAAAILVIWRQERKLIFYL